MRYRAVEPNPVFYAALRRTLELNGLTRVELLELAVAGADNSRLVTPTMPPVVRSSTALVMSTCRRGECVRPPPQSTTSSQASISSSLTSRASSSKRFPRSGPGSSRRDRLLGVEVRRARPTGRGSRLRAVRGSPPSRRPIPLSVVSHGSLESAFDTRDVTLLSGRYTSPFWVRLGGIIAAAPRAVALALPSVLCRWPGRCRVRQSARLFLWSGRLARGVWPGSASPLRHSPSGGR